MSTIDWATAQPWQIVAQLKYDFVNSSNAAKVQIIDGYIVECMISQEMRTGENRNQRPLLDSLTRLREYFDRKAGIEAGNLGPYLGVFRRGI